MWVITRDLFHEKAPNSEVNTESRIGTRGCEHRGSDNNGRVGFRLYDDNEKLLYQGTLDDDEDAVNQESALQYGAIDVGCTIIRVWRNRVGIWVQEFRA